MYSCREGYKAKCSQYWPDEVGTELNTDELTVTMKFVRDDVLYVTRSFLVTDKETEQTVSQDLLIFWCAKLD